MSLGFFYHILYSTNVFALIFGAALLYFDGLLLNMISEGMM